VDGQVIYLFIFKDN